MDTCTSMPISENEEKFIPRDDRISNLPDTVLLHILSFIQTKYVVRTSILSTRWKHLWSSVPNLDFDDDEIDEYETDDDEIDDTRFVDFVNRVLILRDVASIKRCRISCFMQCTAFYINVWVSAAIKHNIQELYLRVRVQGPNFLPYSLLSCESLVVLKLHVDCCIKVPTSVSLPSLKILSLNRVSFRDNTSIHRFFSGCPVLETLTLGEDAWSRLDTIYIDVSTVKKLILHPEMRGGVKDWKINISAENLTSFEYTGNMTYTFSLCNLSSIVDAYVDFSIFAVMIEEVDSRVFELLRGLSGVEVLKLSGDAIQALTHARNLLDDLPTFCNLTYLEVTEGYFFERQVAGEIEKCCCGTLMILLGRFPKLQSLVFSKEFDPPEHHDENDLMSEPVPKCLVSSLKEIKFESFCGMEHELCLIGFLLENSAVLERMTVICSEDISKDMEKQVNIREQVLMLPRGSSCGVIKFP